MPPKNNNTPVDNAAARQQAIEKFLLDPDKAIFETLEQFAPAVMRLVDILSSVNLDEMEQLVGKDGVTPVRGKDYMTEADLQALENFIISKIPKVGVELASRAQVESFIRAEVAKIPRVKGDKGDSVKGEPGENGSPDSGADIVRKLRALGKNQMLKIDDIRGLENVLRNKVSTTDFEYLEKRVDNFKVVFPSNPGGGDHNAEALSIAYQDTAPLGAVNGDLWIDTSVRLDLPVTSPDIRSILTVTQAEYDALMPPDPETLYIIIP